MTNDKDQHDETSSEQQDDEDLTESSDATESSPEEDDQTTGDDDVAQTESDTAEADEKSADDEESLDASSGDSENDESTDTDEESSDDEESVQASSDETDDSDDSDDSDETDETDETDEEASVEASSDETDDSDDSDETDDSDDSDSESSDEDGDEIVDASDDGGDVVPPEAADGEAAGPVKGMAAFFDVPDNLMVAAAHTRDSEYEQFDAYSPFPIHGMDEAMGIGRSWIPWVTFGAGMAGLLTANALQFGTMTFDWPMNIGGKPFAPLPAFVPIMFELSVLFAGVITAIVMLIAAGCFQKPFIIDEEITSDRFALWISADDEAFDADEVRDFMESLDPVEIRTITEKGA